MPCTPKRARLLLERKKAAVYRLFPFTIILNGREDGVVQPVELKSDPGSKTTGMVLVVLGKTGQRVVMAINLHHRGHAVKKRLDQRRGVRRSRRNRHKRHRAPRFNNRRRPEGWLPPTLMSRVHNVETWAKRLQKFSPISTVAVETARFDMQKMENPEFSGVEYQQGELMGYEVREYLLEKWERKCAYCGKGDMPMEVEHIHSKSKGGSDRVSNLTIACRKCNDDKGNLDVRVFLKNRPELLEKILKKARAPLKDAAAVNATRFTIGNALKSLGLPTTFWSGGRTKKNRLSQNYAKDHWVDAACVGETGEKVFIPPRLRAKEIKATGHGDRQLCLMDKYGFPRSKPASSRTVHGFKTGDTVRAIVPTGGKAGNYRGKVAVRATGRFNISNHLCVVQGISYRHCRNLHRADGYSY